MGWREGDGRGPVFAVVVIELVGTVSPRDFPSCCFFMTHTFMVLNNYFCPEISLPKLHPTVTADYFLLNGNGRFQKISIPYHGQLLGFPKGRGGSRLWNSEGMGGGGYLRLDIRRHW